MLAAYHRALDYVTLQERGARLAPLVAEMDRVWARLGLEAKERCLEVAREMYQRRVG